MSTVIQLLTSARLKGRITDGKLEFVATQTTGEAVTLLEVLTEAPPARVELHDFNDDDTVWTFVAGPGWTRVDAHIEQTFPLSPDESPYNFDITAQSTQAGATQTKSEKLSIKIKPIERGPED